LFSSAALVVPVEPARHEVGLREAEVPLRSVACVVAEVLGRLGLGLGDRLVEAVRPPERHALLVAPPVGVVGRPLEDAADAVPPEDAVAHGPSLA